MVARTMTAIRIVITLSASAAIRIASHRSAAARRTRAQVVRKIAASDFTLHLVGNTLSSCATFGHRLFHDGDLFRVGDLARFVHFIGLDYDRARPVEVVHCECTEREASDERAGDHHDDVLAGHTGADGGSGLLSGWQGHFAANGGMAPPQWSQ